MTQTNEPVLNKIRDGLYFSPWSEVRRYGPDSTIALHIRNAGGDCQVPSQNEMVLEFRKKNEKDITTKEVRNMGYDSGIEKFNWSRSEWNIFLYGSKTPKKNFRHVSSRMIQKHYISEWVYGDIIGGTRVEFEVPQLVNLRLYALSYWETSRRLVIRKIHNSPELYRHVQVYELDQREVEREVMKRPSILGRIPRKFITDKLCYRLLNFSTENIKHIPLECQNSRMARIVVNDHPRRISRLREDLQNIPDIYQRALNYNYEAIGLMKNPPREAKAYAIEKSRRAYRFIRKRSIKTSNRQLGRWGGDAFRTLLAPPRRINSDEVYKYTEGNPN